MTQEPATNREEAVEWLSVLPARGTGSEMTPEQLNWLVTAPDVVQAGARVEAHSGQDASGQRRVRLRVSHTEPGAVASTRDALLSAGKRLGLRVFLV